MGPGIAVGLGVVQRQRAIHACQNGECWVKCKWLGVVRRCREVLLLVSVRQAGKICCGCAAGS